MEPQNITEGQSDWQNLFATVYIEVLLYQSYFSYILLLLGLRKSFVIRRSYRGYKRGSITIPLYEIKYYCHETCRDYRQQKDESCTLVIAKKGNKKKLQ